MFGGEDEDGDFLSPTGGLVASPAGWKLVSLQHLSNSRIFC